MNHIQLNCGINGEKPTWQCQGCADQQVATTTLPRNRYDAERLLKNLRAFQDKHAACAARYASMIGRDK